MDNGKKTVEDGTIKASIKERKDETVEKVIPKVEREIKKSLEREERNGNSKKLPEYRRINMEVMEWIAVHVVLVVVVELVMK